MALLEVNNLAVSYKTRNGVLHAVRDVSFLLSRGESLGIIGESGCGKTTIGMSIMGLLPENAGIQAGSILFNGTDIAGLPDRRMQKIRGARISMIFQAAMNSLNPVHRVGDQIAEAIQAHETSLTDKDTARRVEKLFDEVGLSRERVRDFPHQYSGGMKQRAVIAMALACSPELIIADEPTTALDMVVQKQILSKIKEVQKDKDIAVLLISHDMGVISEVCHDVAVVFKGEMIEYGTCRKILDSPQHPYTQKLISSCIKLSQQAVLSDFKEDAEIAATGQTAGKACVFFANCPEAGTLCKTERPGFTKLAEDHRVRCHVFSDV